MNDEQINNLIDECIDHLCDDNMETGAESLVELAQLWAKAGLPQYTFDNMRQFIVNQACERTDKAFINEKLRHAERKLRDTRISIAIH
jgi:hypothetical protein